MRANDARVGLLTVVDGTAVELLYLIGPSPLIPDAQAWRAKQIFVWPANELDVHIRHGQRLTALHSHVRRA